MPTPPTNPSPQRRPSAPAAGQPDLPPPRPPADPATTRSRGSAPQPGDSSTPQPQDGHDAAPPDAPYHLRQTLPPTGRSTAVGAFSWHVPTADPGADFALAGPRPSEATYLRVVSSNLDRLSEFNSSGGALSDEYKLFRASSVGVILMQDLACSSPGRSTRVVSFVADLAAGWGGPDMAHHHCLTDSARGQPDHGHLILVNSFWSQRPRQFYDDPRGWARWSAVLIVGSAPTATAAPPSVLIVSLYVPCRSSNPISDYQWQAQRLASLIDDTTLGPDAVEHTEPRAQLYADLTRFLLRWRGRASILIGGDGNHIELDLDSTPAANNEAASPSPLASLLGADGDPHQLTDVGASYCRDVLDDPTLLQLPPTYVHPAQSYQRIDVFYTPCRLLPLVRGYAVLRPSAVRPFASLHLPVIVELETFCLLGMTAANAFAPVPRGLPVMRASNKVLTKCYLEHVTRAWLVHQGPMLERIRAAEADDASGDRSAPAIARRDAALADLERMLSTAERCLKRFTPTNRAPHYTGALRAAIKHTRFLKAVATASRPFGHHRAAAANAHSPPTHQPASPHLHYHVAQLRDFERAHGRPASTLPPLREGPRPFINADERSAFHSAAESARRDAERAATTLRLTQQESLNAKMFEKVIGTDKRLRDIIHTGHLLKSMYGAPTKGAGHFTICEGSGVRARIYDTASTVSERARDHMAQHFRGVGVLRTGDRVLHRRADQPDRAGTVTTICGDGTYCVNFGGFLDHPPIRGAALRLPCGSLLSWTCDTALLCDSPEGRELRRLITTHGDDFDFTAPPHRIPGYFRLALRHWRRLPAALPSLYGDLRRHATEKEWFDYWRLTSKGSTAHSSAF